MKQSQTQRTMWHLEQRIWAAIDKAYGGNLDEIKNLQERLTSYFSEVPSTQRAIQRGLEELSSDEGLVRNVQTVVDEKLLSYQRTARKGIDTIFYGKDPSFLRDNVREKRDWLVRYSALLHVLDRDNGLIKETINFVNDVQTLLTIYHNLIVEHERFAQEMTYENYTSSMANTERNVKDLGVIRSRDKIINQGVTYLMEFAYAKVATILYAFVNSLRDGDIGRQKINPTKLEATRVRIAQRVEGMRDFDILGYDVLDFYLGERKVIDLLRAPKS